MKYTISRYLLFFILLVDGRLCAISMVYNFRIAQITKQPIFENQEKRKHRLIALLFDQYRKKYDEIYQNFIGGLGSYIHNFDFYYFRTDFAVSHIKEITDHITTFTGTETDDILFTAGRNFILTPNTVMTFSGLLGIPTHRIFRLQHTDFGYSQIGTGLQLDFSSELSLTSALLYGARYIYFVPRKAFDDTHLQHTFSIGNIADFLIAYKNAWPHHGLEYGYTARFRFGARISPPLDDIVKKTNYIRSNFYIVYKYKFKTNTVSHRFLFNISYGFDHVPKMYGNKYIVTLWASWNISF